MDLTNITTVSKELNISTRTLRYYEQIGLISSTRSDGYAYRVYDEDMIVRIKQIILLKALNIKLKDIGEILQNQDAMTAIRVFQNEIETINSSIDSLSAVKDMLNILIKKLQESSYTLSADKLLSDKSVTDIISPMCLNNNSKENINMSNLKKDIKANGLDGEIRIIHFPPCYVAAANNYGIEPENKALRMVFDFAREKNLSVVKPDFRVAGFNNPMPMEGKKEYGYEFWVTIPEDMDVSAPMEKKHFEGGLYAAYCIKMGDFHKWADFTKWVEQSKEYEYEKREPLGMFGSLEEHLNAYSYLVDETQDMSKMQLDLLIPIKMR